MTWEQWIGEYEHALRLGFFFSVLLLVAGWEVFRPRRALKVSKLRRWTNNIGLLFFYTVLLRVLLPVGAVAVAAHVSSLHWGLFGYLDWPPLITVICCVILLDFAIYLQHVMLHSVPMLWRLHRVHHADLDYDVTTGVRFHPIEIVLSMLLKFMVIMSLGAPPEAVLIFEILLSSTAMFNHGNIQLPVSVDRWLRLLVVTPDMHRVHHSVEDDETNSNFGFNLPWWDRLMGTYRQAPRLSQTQMDIGIRTFREERDCVRWWGLMMMPFQKFGEGYTINRRDWEK